MSDTDNIAAKLNQRAGESFSKGNYNEALAFCAEAEKLYRVSGNMEGLGSTLHNQALAINAKGDLQTAIKLYEEAEQINRQVGTPEGQLMFGQCLGTLGQIYIEQQDWPKVITKMREAYEVFSQLGMNDKAVVCLEYLDEALRQSGMAVLDSIPSAAADYIGETVNVRRRLGSMPPYLCANAEKYQSSIGGLLQIQAELLAKTNRKQEALNLAQEAYDLAIQGGLSKEVEKITALIAQIQNPDVENSLGNKAASQLACVHCGQTDDPSLSNPEYRIEIRVQGDYIAFAQCSRCFTRLQEAGAGYFATRSMIGSYSEEQRNRAIIIS